MQKILLGSLLLLSFIGCAQRRYQGPPTPQVLVFDEKKNLNLPAGELFHSYSKVDGCEAIVTVYNAGGTLGGQRIYKVYKFKPDGSISFQHSYNIIETLR